MFGFSHSTSFQTALVIFIPLFCLYINKIRSKKTSKIKKKNREGGCYLPHSFALPLLVIILRAEGILPDWGVLLLSLLLLKL